MVSSYLVKNPPKRKIPKYRVSRKHHYVMKFPVDLLTDLRYVKCFGLAYINFFDSFLEDCVKRIADSANCDLNEFKIMTACLN